MGETKLTDGTPVDQKTLEESERHLTSEERYDIINEIEPHEMLNVREALKEIAKILARSREPNQVAIVLRAMRGPDNEDYVAKSAGTMPIRLEAFGEETAGMFGEVSNSRYGPDRVETCELVHWRVATHHAAELLGLYQR